MYVYVLTNKYRGTRYIGVTNDLKKRLYEHRTKKDPNSYCSKYNIYILLYYEQYNNPSDAIAREKQLKGWTRVKKDKLIEKMNPDLIDLAKDWDNY